MLDVFCCDRKGEKKEKKKKEKQKGVSKTKQNKKKAHEKIDFHNSVQDWVLTTVYQVWSIQN